MFSSVRFCLRLILLAVLVTSCGPAPTLSFPTSTPPQPTVLQSLTPADESSLFQAGLRYGDTSGDMEISFLDVVGFQASVDEEAEILEIILHLRDIPPMATRRQIRNIAEYMWDISVFIDPAKKDATDPQPDYGFMVLTTVADPSSKEGILTPRAGEAEVVPINQLWDAKIIYNSLGENLSTLDVVADPDTETLTLTGRVPGITSNAVFGFATVHHDGAMDRPDNYVPSESADRSTPLAKATQALQRPTIIAAEEETPQLIPAGAVRAYPGPEHYAGDVLTFEVKTDGNFDESDIAVRLTLDDQNTVEITGQGLFDRVVLPLALDTTELVGVHTVRFSTLDGALSETYSFEVLPGDERPANEASAAWRTNEIACCVLHYISETAAARDIELIAEHFEQAAEDFSTITGSDIDPKLDVYIMDRIWGNGGFGGNGELVISYTDRYYGPTQEGVGLETLARHEFTHAAAIGLAGTGNGVEFNYEGLAVYVAGGHYKPEPLAERGAALFDLGHYVPVGQFLQQHELAYLYPAAMLTYIDETYGTEKMWEFLASDDNLEDDQPGSLEAALQDTLRISLKDFDQNFRTWLQSKEPGKQLDDLRLTVELQDLRRKYQNTYSPPPDFLLAEAAKALARPEYLPVVIREARTPANIAVELMIANGQQAILDGDYSRAEELNKILAKILSTGTFEEPLAKTYLDIVLAAASAGYEVVNLEIQEDRASARVTMNPPILSDLDFEKVDSNWQIQP